MQHEFTGFKAMASKTKAGTVTLPPTPGGWLAVGAAALAMGDQAAALHAYGEARRRSPLHPQVYVGLAAVLDAQGQGREALAHRMAAMALASRSALDLYNIATAYLMAGHSDSAESWYRLTLQLDPELVVAHRNLATLLRDTGRAIEAQHHTDFAYGRQFVFDNDCATAQLTVWLICAGGRGNVPLELWFDHASTRRIEYFVEYVPHGGPTTPAQVLSTYACPRPDLIFNAIGDPDVAAPVLAPLLAFVDAAQVPVLNSPRAVARTARDCLPQLLDGIDGLVTPPVTRITDEHEARACLAQAGQPILIRPIATHGGEGLVLVDAQAALAEIDWQSAPAFFVAPYYDYRSADGYFRKYRAIFIDGRPYPYHLAISSHWLVHYFSADMLGQADKQAEEARFLSDAAGVLGGRAWQALEAVGARLELDYAGIDFALLADGRILVFEANATMLVRREPPGSELAYKNAYIATLEDAFRTMIQRRRSEAPPQI
jgi:hypothetical protein